VGTSSRVAPTSCRLVLSTTESTWSRSLAAAALAARSRLGIRASLAAVVTCVYHNKEDYVNKNQNGSQTTYFTSFYSDECSKFTQGLFQKLFGFQRPIWTAKLQSTGCSGLLGHWVSPKD